jgi:hypothetical protein
MTKLPLPREHHRDPMLVGGGDDFGVAHRPSRLDDRSDAGLRGLFGRLEARPVPERLISIVDQLDAAEPPRRKMARG